MNFRTKYLVISGIFIVFAVVITVFIFFKTPPKIVMGYWGYPDKKSVFLYPVPGSKDIHGNIITNEDFEKKLDLLNVIAYAFLQVNKEGYVHFQNSYIDLLPTDLNFCKTNKNICIDSTGQINPQLGNFNAFTKLQNRNHTLKKIFSIGGDGKAASFYFAINNMDNFINSVAIVLNHYELSGVDLDFEINTHFTPEKAQKYVQLITKLRNKLGASFFISMAIPADIETLQSIGAQNWQEIAKNVNYISVMCYNFHHPSLTANLTGYNSNLYLDAKAPQDFYHISCDKSLKYLISLGVPAKKIILGYPSYGISYGGVAKTNDGLFQHFNFAMTPTFDEKGPGLLKYLTVIKLLSTGFKEHVSFYNGGISAVWAYNPETQVVITYDNVALIKEKARYIRANHLAGAMTWLINYDIPADSEQSLLKTMAENL